MKITKELVEEYRVKYPNYSITQLARQIAFDHSFEYTDSTRRTVSRKLPKREKAGKESISWDEKNDSAVFEYNGTKKIDNFEDAIAYSGVDKHLGNR
jgi:hypothetical protein